MSDVTEWIEAASCELRRPFTRCNPHEAKEIEAKARDAFVSGNPRVWWLSLKAPFKLFDSDTVTFLEVVPEPVERVWFIAEDDSRDLPVYDLLAEDVDLIRSNCPLFEYYVVEPNFRWLVIESDHDKFIVCTR